MPAAEQPEPAQAAAVVRLDALTTIAYLDETGGELAVVLTDWNMREQVRFPLSGDADDWRLVRGIVRALEALEQPVRRRTIGYRHGPLTGPVPWPRG